MTFAIEVEGVVKRYGELAAVAGLDLGVERGRCQGLLGPNGAGKSTTVGMLVGLIAPDAGTVRVLGRRWGGDDAAIRESIGVQLQETRLTDKLTVRELLTLFRGFYRRGRTPEEVIELVGLEDKAGARYQTLSGGQQQRLALGCALVNRPQVLFLDEPTTGLDPQARRRVWEIVEEFRRDGGTVLLTTHYMDEAEQLCDSIAIVDHGKAIASGSPREIIDSLGAESLVEFSLLTGAPPDEQRLAGLPGVLRLHRNAELTTLHVKAAHETVPALMEHLKATGAELGDLRTHRPTLEDVFVTLTGRQLRDG